MPYTNQNKAIEYRRSYYAKYRQSDKYKQYIHRYRQRRQKLNKEYYLENNDNIIKNSKIYRINNIKSIKERKLSLRLEVFEAYGGPNCCLCGESRLGALTIDHIAQNGAKQRLNGQLVGLLYIANYVIINSLMDIEFYVQIVIY